MLYMRQDETTSIKSRILWISTSLKAKIFFLLGRISHKRQKRLKKISNYYKINAMICCKP